ncbi:helix-turn-helix domain-containing protein [Nocardia sp. IFM 10818]
MASQKRRTADHRNDPNALRFLIGRELRSARDQARVSQAVAAQHLGCTQAKINHLESGRNNQSAEEVTALLTFYGSEPAQIERIAALTERADQTAWLAPFEQAFPAWFRTFVGLEGLASAVTVYESMLVPGQLQTADYAAALLEHNLRVAPMDAPAVVEARLARQRLTTANPLTYRAVLEEAVLDRRVGGAQIMRRQLEHLLQLMALDHVEIQVMPLEVAVHPGLDGDFMVLEFDQAQPIGYVEYPAGAVYIQSPDLLDLYRMAAKRLRAAALTPADSADAIRRRVSALSEQE